MSSYCATLTFYKEANNFFESKALTENNTFFIQMKSDKEKYEYRKHTSRVSDFIEGFYLLEHKNNWI